MKKGTSPESVSHRLRADSPLNNSLDHLREALVNRRRRRTPSERPGVHFKRISLTTMLPEDKRLIEAAFPLKQVSLDSVHEKNVRHGHISTLHIWPARRPLAACRAALIATLLPDPGNPEERKAILERMAGRIIREARAQARERPRGRAGQGGDGGRHPALGPGERARTWSGSAPRSARPTAAGRPRSSTPSRAAARFPSKRCVSGAR